MPASGCSAVDACDRAALGHGGAVVFGVFFFNDTATTEIYTLSLHDALPIWRARRAVVTGLVGEGVAGGLAAVVAVAEGAVGVEGHASVGRVAELGGGEGSEERRVGEGGRSRGGAYH